MIQGARGWCTGMTQRDGVGKKVGGGFRMGNTCTPVADSCQCMAKPREKKKKEYTEELDKKDLQDPDNHDGVITHLG